MTNFDSGMYRSIVLFRLVYFWMQTFLAKSSSPEFGDVYKAILFIILMIILMTNTLMTQTS